MNNNLTEKKTKQEWMELEEHYKKNNPHEGTLVPRRNSSPYNSPGEAAQ